MKLGTVRYEFIRNGRVRSNTCDTVAEAVAFADYDHESGAASFRGIYVGNVLWIDHGTWLSGLINRRSQLGIV